MVSRRDIRYGVLRKPKNVENEELFARIKAIREATPEELGIVLPKDASQAVYDHFHRKAEEPCELLQEAAEE